MFHLGQNLESTEGRTGILVMGFGSDFLNTLFQVKKSCPPLFQSPSVGFLFPMRFFLIQPFLDCPLTRLGFQSDFFGFECFRKQLIEFLDGKLLVLELGSCFLGVDDQDTFRGHFGCVFCQQDLPFPIHQKFGVMDVKTKANLCIHFIDVLPTRATAAGGLEFQFGIKYPLCYFF